MKIINIKSYYPFVESDYLCEVSDEIADMLKQFKRKDHAEYERRRVHRAYYSLNADDGIENRTVFLTLSTEEIYEEKQAKQMLYAAINKLSKKQANRIYAYFFLGLKIIEIARFEGIEQSAIGQSIQRGLKRLSKILKNI